MSDEQDLLGRWQLSFRQWIWEYTFLENKTVKWRDIYNNQTGSGQWVMTNKLVNIRWYKSTTKESWYRPIIPKGQKGWIDASYGVGAFTATQIEKYEPGAMSFDYSVGPVPVIMQGHAPVCWAAAVSMMLGWRKNNLGISIDQGMSLMGEPYVSLYAKKKPLNQTTFLQEAPHLDGIRVRDHYATASGLKYEPLRSYSPKQLYQLMLMNRSPLLVEAYWDDDWTHDYVVKRISGSNEHDTLIELNDPNEGSDQMGYTDFMEKVEKAASRVDIQVWHY